MQVSSSPPFDVSASFAAVSMFAWSVSGRSIDAHTSPTLRGESESHDVGQTMFHTFQSSNGMRSPGGDTDSSGKPSRPPGSRRISTSNACVECRRRKIRCDGSKPCGQCQWYQHPEASRLILPLDRFSRADFTGRRVATPNRHSESCLAESESH